MSNKSIIYWNFGELAFLGLFNKRPINLENTKKLVEYIKTIDNYLEKALSSFGEDLGESIKHTIYGARKSEPQHGDSKYHTDKIYLIKSDYFVDKSSGEITFIQERIKTVEGY